MMYRDNPSCPSFVFSQSVIYPNNDTVKNKNKNHNFLLFFSPFKIQATHLQNGHGHQRQLLLFPICNWFMSVWSGARRFRAYYGIISFPTECWRLESCLWAAPELVKWCKHRLCCTVKWSLTVTATLLVSPQKTKSVLKNEKIEDADKINAWKCLEMQWVKQKERGCALKDDVHKYIQSLW